MKIKLLRKINFYNNINNFILIDQLHKVEQVKQTYILVEVVDLR